MKKKRSKARWQEIIF